MRRKFEKQLITENDGGGERMVKVSVPQRRQASEPPSQPARRSLGEVSEVRRDMSEGGSRVSADDDDTECDGESTDSTPTATVVS